MTDKSPRKKKRVFLVRENEQQEEQKQQVPGQDQQLLTTSDVEEEEKQDDEKESTEPQKKKKTKSEGRKRVPIKFITEKTRRQTTFSKRKSGLMKKAYELTTLTGTQCVLVIASETGHIYTFASPKFQKMITTPEGQAWIKSCVQEP